MGLQTTRLYKDLLSLQGHLVDGRIEDEVSGLIENYSSAEWMEFR